MRNKSPQFWLLAAIVTLGAALRFWGLQWGLPYEYQSEEYKIVKYALRMGGGDLNPHFFEYPSLYLYVMLAVYGIYFVIGRIFGVFAGSHEFALSFVKDPTMFYLMGRVIEASCGAAMVYVTFWVGRRFYSEKTGLIAAFFVAALPDLIYVSHIFKGYMGMMILLFAFFYWCVRMSESGRTRDYVIASLFLGLAISTRYHAAPFGIVLVWAHFYRLYFAQDNVTESSWKEHGKFVLSLALIPVFFYVATPYALITPLEFWRDLGANVKVYSGITGTEGPLISRMGIAANRLYFLGDIGVPRWCAAILAGGGLAGLFAVQAKDIFLILPIVTYYFIVGGYHNPAAGYLMQIYPLYIIWCVKGLTEVRGKFLTGLSYVLVAVAAGWCLWAGMRWSYSFTVEDTRTAGKKWIEQNIPAGSRVLVDVRVQTPPILMSYEQIERLHNKAVELNHYKKEYLQLQLEAHPGKGNGYEIFTVQRSFHEIGSLPHMVEEVQKMQDLIEAGGDLDRIKKAGIQYAVISMLNEEGSRRNNYTELVEFYDALRSKAKLLSEFSPTYPIYQGGGIRVYQL